MSVTSLVFAANAQEFQKGTNIISAGIGLGSSILSYSGASQSPALSLQYERGVWDIGGPGVISLGGYAAGPVVLAALWKKRPLVVMEPNAMPGLTNRKIGRFVRRRFDRRTLGYRPISADRRNVGLVHRQRFQLLLRDLGRMMFQELPPRSLQ